MKCPACEGNIPFFKALVNDLFRVRRCPHCHENYTLTLSIGRMALLMIPVALTMLMAKQLFLMWGYDSTLGSILVIILYGLSCLTMRRAGKTQD